MESGENENQYVNGPEESTCEDILGETDLPVANAGTECPVIEEVTPANFISYGWQIASGMVQSYVIHHSVCLSHATYNICIVHSNHSDTIKHAFFHSLSQCIKK